MAQVKTFTWTNTSGPADHNLDCGFDPAEVTVVDVTNGGSWYWNVQMGDGYVLAVDTGTVSTSNGVTPLAQGAVFGAAISAFTNDSPGVITASNIGAVGIAAGDTIKVAGVADDASGTSLNQDSTFTVASVTATTITLDQNTSAYSVWVSGGHVTRVSDTNGDPVPTQNVAIRGVTLGSNAVGAASAVMVATVRGAQPVV